MYWLNHIIQRYREHYCTSVEGSRRYGYKNKKTKLSYQDQRTVEKVFSCVAAIKILIQSWGDHRHTCATAAWCGNYGSWLMSCLPTSLVEGSHGTLNEAIPEREAMSPSAVAKTSIVWFQKISIPPPQKGLEIPEGWGSQRPRKYRGGGLLQIRNYFPRRVKSAENKAKKKGSGKSMTVWKKKTKRAAWSLNFLVWIFPVHVPRAHKYRQFFFHGISISASAQVRLFS